MLMSAAGDLLDLPLVHEIVIGDFGRAAALDYMRFACVRERALIRSRLKSDELEFFDEYRRLMFTVLGDVGFYKAELIAQTRQTHGHLTREVLIGGGMTPVTSDIVERIAVTVAHAAASARARGYERVQLALPCNALSDVATGLREVLATPQTMDELFGRSRWPTPDPDLILGSELSVRTVPESVLTVLSKEAAVTAPRLLLLGAEGALEIYGRLSDDYGVLIVPIDTEQQTLIDDAVITAIGGDEAELRRSRDRLRQELIEPAKEAFGELTVVEACTDFSFGLGVSSVELFAEDLINTCYG